MEKKPEKKVEKPKVKCAECDKDITSEKKYRDMPSTNYLCVNCYYL